MRRLVLNASVAALLVLLWGCSREVHVREHPPAIRVEIIGVAPSPRHVWIEGYWRWDGRWVWIPGYWVESPHEHSEWERGHWRETRRGWIRIEGRWRD